MIPISRPQKYDNSKMYSDNVYVGWVRLLGLQPNWARGLIARRIIPKGMVIAEYTGKTSRTPNPASDYLLAATSTEGNVVIDGDPKYGGIASYANYAPWSTSNSFFIDDLLSKRAVEPSYKGTYVILIAKHNIPSGQEIRCDYDTASMGDYRDKLIIEQKVRPEELDSNEYLYNKWTQPRTLGRFVTVPCNIMTEVSKLAQYVSQRRPLKRKRGRPTARDRFIQF